VGQFKRALDEYERALALGNPNVGWVSYSAASASMKLGDTDAALKWIEN
jgi:tetratricopeptide (TPR) repeat protein